MFKFVQLSIPLSFPDEKINDLYDPKVTGVGHQRETYFKGK